ncbi:hypothetical protein HDU86_004748 [Geranomyces michiganensis]|nr:hypothetical protein HDU86_004748 [Geranomyces michiganensis]
MDTSPPHDNDGIAVLSLHVFPVKSCRGIAVSHAAIGPYGFELDRFWMLAEPPSAAGRPMTMVTQRTHPQLAHISTALFLNNSAQPATAIPPAALAAGGDLVLSAPGMSNDLRIPFTAPASAPPLSLVTAELHHGEQVLCRDEGEYAAEWLERFLGFPARLVRKNTEAVRGLNPLHTPSRALFESEPQTALADGYPFLILSNASVADLNVRLAARNAPAVTLHNFRPNIYISSQTPYIEDTFLTISINSHEMYIASRCVRCVLPNNDPETAIPHKKEPLATLMAYRRVDPGSKWMSCFGMNATHREAGWVVSVGDVVKVTRSGEMHNLAGIWRGRREPLLVDEADDTNDDVEPESEIGLAPPATSSASASSLVGDELARRTSPILWSAAAVGVVILARLVMANRVPVW